MGHYPNEAGRSFDLGSGLAKPGANVVQSLWIS